MRRFFYRTLSALLCIVGALTLVEGQDWRQEAAGEMDYNPAYFINTEINTGDPTYPFPQFLEYPGGGKSLAKYNAEGVTHADMEKDMREGYEIMMHRARYWGGEQDGVKYISYNMPGVPGYYGTWVSEGDGYAMLAAAIFADQKTFNGLYMWIHDNRMSGVKRFKDGRVLRAELNDFAGPYLAGWQNDEDTKIMSPSHSATDGDVDIALAMLIAYKQWGEWMMQDGRQVKDSEGNPISLKEEAYRVVTALVDTFPQYDPGNFNKFVGYMTGDVGLDGYCKNGNSWSEMSGWRDTPECEAAYPGYGKPYTGQGSNAGMYMDYDAPSYFEEFYRWLCAEGGEGKKCEWHKHQFKRAAASGNWLNREAYNQGYIASIGRASFEADGVTPKFGVYMTGEDFRYAWRHLIGYLWHGEQKYDWDPKTHQVIEGTNNSQYDMAIRHAEMLRMPKNGDEILCSKLGSSPDPGQPKWCGIAQARQQWNLDGTICQDYRTVYSVGSGSPAAVISEDLDLVADVYRQSVLLWDGNHTLAVLPDEEERYEGSTPKYFHGWFRTLGMLVSSGNCFAPSYMKPQANMKVYMSVDKTYAYQDDEIEYTVDYRNYGSLAAEGVVITTPIDENYEVVSITGPGTFKNGKIVWSLPEAVPGFKTGGLEATIGSVGFKVRVKGTANPRICLTSTISGSNFPNWVSNEFPNNATYTMERNCVDILASRTLSIKKTVNRTKLNPGDVATFTLEFENKSEGESSWLNGGRDNFCVSYANNPTVQINSFLQFFRFWNDAYESYVNMKNYRVSYFMYDASAKGLYDAQKNKTGWTLRIGNDNDIRKYRYSPDDDPISFSYQKIPQGGDPETGMWNQRLIIRFGGVLMAPSTHVYDKLNTDYLLHKGVFGPSLLRIDLVSNPAGDMTKRVLDDWSYADNISTTDNSGQQESYFPVSPCWADPNNPGYEIKTFSRHVCEPSEVPTFRRLLVEEFDGYTWRRIQGTGPLPGREAYNVEVKDTIPYELEWVGWIDETALKNEAGEKIKATYTPSADPEADGYTGVIYWTIPEMLVGEKDKLVYQAKARDLGCPDVDDVEYINAAWISSETDSPDSSRVELLTTCAPLPPQFEKTDALTKTASTKMAQDGDDVSYEIVFKNTLGTTIDADCNSQKGWKALGKGSLPTIRNGGGLWLSTTSPAFFAPEKSWGSDGEFTIQFDKATKCPENFYIVMRYVDGTPGQPGFKGIAIKLLLNNTGENKLGMIVYNNDTEIERFGETYETVTWYQGDALSPTFKFRLVGDELFMYCNDEEDEWTSVMKAWSGLPTEPGYFGLYANSNGNADLGVIKYKTELDYAFDVTVGDILPAQLEEITDMTDNGEYDESTHTIKWPTIATTIETAIAPNETVTYKFDARVKNCKDFVVNTAWATVFSTKDSLWAGNTITCGVAGCELTEVTLNLDVPTICEGDSALLRATAKELTEGGNYTYEFSLGKTAITDPETYKWDTIFVKEAGSYSVTVYDLDNKCTVSSLKNVKLAVDDRPTEKLQESVAVCDGADLSLADLTLEDYDIIWYSDNAAVEEVDAETAVPATKVRSEYYYIVKDKVTGCESDIETLTVNKDAIPDPPTTTDKEYGVANGKKDISNLATSDNRVAWYESMTAKDSITDTPVKVSLATPLDTTFYVSSVTELGCESERVPVTITVTNSNVPDTRDTTICIGQTVDVVSLVTPEAGSTLVWYDKDPKDGGVKIGEPDPFTSTEAGETTYYVAQDNGVAVSDAAPITITTVGVGAIETPEPVNLCAGQTDVVELSVKADASSVSEFVKIDKESSFVWSIDGVVIEDKVPSTKVGATTTYTITPTYTISADNVCKGKPVELPVTVTKISLPTVNANTITYALQDTTAAGVFRDLLTQEENAVVASEGNSLVWFNEDRSLIGNTAPTPEAHRKMTENEEYTYLVIQTDGTCASDTVTISVIVSATPTPKPTIAYFCQDEVTTKTLADFVTPTDGYTLVWYSDDVKNGGTVLDEIPSISTALTDPTKTEEEKTYYVAQTNSETTSSTVALKVVVLAKPRLKTSNAEVCNKAVNLDNLWEVSNAVDNVHPEFYDDENAMIANWTAIAESGTYHVLGYFENPTVCRGSVEDIVVKIHKIDTFYIEGPKTTCPDKTVSLKTVYEGENFGATLTYEWSATNNSAKAADGEFESDPLSAPQTFTVSMTDGFCPKTATHKVNIDKGAVSGTITFDEADNALAGEPELVDGESVPLFYSCGGTVTATADLAATATDFKWSDGTVGPSLATTEPGTYTITYTNVCETSQTIKIVSAKIVDNTVGEDLSLCEGLPARLQLSYSTDETAKLVWTKDDVEYTGPTSFTSVKPENAGLYAYEITSKGCKKAAVYGDVKVFARPTYDKLPVEDVCSGSSTVIGVDNLTDGYSVTWESGPTLTAIGNTASVRPTEETTYNFTVSQTGGCSLPDKITVEVSEPVELELEPSTAKVCVGSGEVKLHAVVKKGTASSYSWTDKNNIEKGNTSQLRVPTDEIGVFTYTLTAMSGACAPAIEIATVEVVGLPEIDTVVRLDFKDIEIQAVQSSGSGSYEYKVDAGEYQEESKFSSVKYATHTAYVRDGNGCVSTKTFTLTAPELEIPTVVTPNGDGDNDIFRPEVLAEAYPDAKVTIYDRFGKALVEVTASEGWDGTYQGRRMPSTDYWYEIWVEEIRKTYTGHFTLIND